MRLKNLFGRWRRRSWLVASAVVFLVAAGSIYWFGYGPATASTTATAVSTNVTVRLQPLVHSVSASGTLTPTSQTAVSFVASGTVTAVNVTAGSTVTAGQTLATVDTLTERSNLLSAKANLAAAQATLASAQTASSGSTAELAKIAADQAAVTVATASVTAAQTKYDGTTLVSPVGGLVTAVNTAVGNVISSGSSASGSSSASAGGSSGSTVSASASSAAAFTIVGTGSWSVAVSLGASDIKNVKVAQQVNLATTENTAFFGTVASIGLLPTTSTGAATYPVVIAVTGSPTQLFDGVTATAKIVYKKRTDVLTVRAGAVTTANGVSTVQKIVGDKKVKTTVGVGETVGNLTEITKGLAAGDQVSETLFTIGKGNAGTTRGNWPGGFQRPDRAPGNTTGGATNG